MGIDDSPQDPEISKAGAAAGAAMLIMRQAMGLSRIQVADRLGISAGHVGYLEEGKRVGSLDTYIRVAALYGMKLGDLFDGVVPDQAKLLGPSVSLDGLTPRQVVLVSALVKELRKEAV